MKRVNRLLSRLLGLANSKRTLRDKNWRLGLELLEDRTVPSTLVQVANVDGYVADTDLNGVFDTVNTTGTAVQTSSIATAGATTDQSNTTTPWVMYNIGSGSNTPIGQEFRPNQSSLNWVDLFIEDAGSDIGPGANFQVAIRSGTISGPVVATTTGFVPDGTNTGGGSTYTRFNFGSAVPLTPGSTYVIQVVQTSTGSGTENFMLVSDNTGTDTYTNGRAIIAGTPSSTQVDFLFREGTNGSIGVSERGVMEFSTTGITSSSIINSVTFSGTISLLQNGTPSAMSVSFLAYSGDGQITTADANPTVLYYTSFSPTALGTFSINFDAATIQSIIRSAGYSGYIGVRVQLNNGQRFFLSSTEQSTSGAPTLTINYDGPSAVNDLYRINQGATQLSVAAPGVLGNDTHPVGTTLTASLVGGPSFGTVSLAADGSFVYTPNGQFTTSDSFTYQASNGVNVSNIATVNIRVERPPVTFSRNYVGAVNSMMSVPVASGVLSNNYDLDNDPITAVLVTGPSHGTLTLNSNGSFTYVPNTDYTGPDQFTFQASDGMLLSNVGTASLYIDAIPVAANDSYSVDQGTTLTVAAPGVLANDTDANNDPLTAFLVTGPSHGTLSLSGNGGFTYTPAAGYYGSDSFTYKDSDGFAGSNVATVNLTVNHVVTPPIANDDAYSVNEDQTLTVALTPGVTSLVMQSQPGDYIGQGQNYSYSSSTGVFSAIQNFDHGVSLAYQDTLNANAWWFLDFAAPGNAPLVSGTYLNATRYPFQGPTSPGLDIAGEGRGSNTLTGQFTVLQIDYLPNNQIGRFDATFEQHSEGATAALTGEIKYNYSTAPSGVLINDQSSSGNPLSAILVSGPQHGTLALNADGTFTYTPSANYNGADSFTYKANDGNSDSNVATVTINVNPVNDPPVANNDSYSTDEDTTLTFAAPGVLGNDTDVDSPTLTAILVTGASHGSVALNSDGSFSYTPAANYNGSDSFTYRTNDGSASSFIATVNLFVRPVNDAPVANNNSYSTNEDTPLSVASPGVLGNDGDVDGNTLTAILVSGPSHGSLTLNANGSFSYTPAANYNGSDSFTYKANDGALDSNVATVVLTINAVNDAPIAADDSLTTNEDTPLTVAAPGVVGNDSDVDGDALTATLVAGPSHGVLTLNADGSFSYTPAANYNGSDSFTYKANDGAADSNVATVALTIAPVNDAPAAANDVFSTNEDTPLTVAAPGVLGNDSDLEGDDLTATLLNGPAHGTLTFNADGSFSYTPSANYNGSDSFTYKANDGALDSNVATVTLTIVAVNDAPAAADNAYTTDEDTAFTIAAPGVLGNDSDVDGDTLTSILVSGPAHGALTLNSDGSFTYTPAANYNGPDSFTYKANDGAADSNIATVLLTINPINDAPIADAGPDQTAAEGAAVSFTGLASSDVEGDPLTYSWSFSDGGSASGATPSHVFADNGNYLVTLTVSDGQLTSSDTMMVMVTNVAPTASLSGPATGVRGQARTISLGASDPSIADQAASFTYAITWGDGSTQSISGPASAQASHVFTAAGAFTVTVTATDKDGGVSQVVQQIINIKSVDLQGTTLAIGGTTAGDAITVKPANSSGSLNVTINGANQGNFMPAQLLIYGQAGNDNIQLDTVKIQGVTYRVTAPAVILGGDGSDIIDAQGSSADNILIGGAGSDTLQGGATDDIVIGGTTDFDANSDALLALLAECSRSDASEETRLNHLNGTLPGGLNGAFFLTAATVHDDGATDQLYGNGGNDWFFALTTGANADRLRDAVNGEVITHL